MKNSSDEIPKKIFVVLIVAFYYLLVYYFPATIPNTNTYIYPFTYYVLAEPLSAMLMHKSDYKVIQIKGKG